jgi:hypothetical protein
VAQRWAPASAPVAASRAVAQAPLRSSRRS